MDTQFFPFSSRFLKEIEILNKQLQGVYRKTSALKVQRLTVHWAVYIFLISRFSSIFKVLMFHSNFGKN